MPRLIKYQTVYSPDKLARPIIFEGMAFPYKSKKGDTRYIGPTDLDALLDFRGKAWVLIECKEEEARWPTGQMIALRRLFNDLHSQRPSLLIRATHPKDVTEIDLASATVHSFLDRPMYRGQWKYLEEPMSVREMVDCYLEIWDLTDLDT